jgi:hypothetical protein
MNAVRSGLRESREISSLVLISLLSLTSLKLDRVSRTPDGDGRTTAIFGAPGFETTYVDTFHLIGQGQGADLLAHTRLFLPIRLRLW